jgi:hypothetical protein
MTQTAAYLARKAVEWWCPDDRITSELINEVGAELYKAQAALEEKDWSTFHATLNRVAISSLGHDDENQEEELLAYLDDLVRGYH